GAPGSVPNNGVNTYDVVNNAGTILLNISPTIEKLTLNGGSIESSGSITLNDLFTFSGGGIHGSATANANGGVLFNTGSTKQIGAGRTLNIGDGVGAAGSVTASWTGGIINNLAPMNVRSDAAFGTNFDGTMSGGGSPTGSLNIDAGGSFTKSGGTGTTFIGPSGSWYFLNNNGTVNVQTGTLAIGAGSNGGTHTGLFNLSSGATLDLGGIHHLNAGVSFAGAGTLIMSGTINANTTVDVPMPLTLTGTLQGTGTLNASGAVTWSSGTMTNTGTTNILASIAIDTAGTKFINSGRTVNIGDGIGAAGSVAASWSGGLITNLSPMNVRSDAAFTTNFDGSMQGGGSPGGALNINAGGSFTKSGGTGTTSIGTDGNWFSFNNSGTVNVSSGTLALGGGAGSVTQHSGTTLTGGTWNVTNGASINITNGSNITTNQGTVMLDGAGSSFNRLTTALNNNQGSFTLKNDRDLTTADAYINSGTTRVEDSTTTMTIGADGSAAYTQTIGETVLVGGAMIDASVFNLNGGELKGSGTIASSVVTGGTQTIAPGLSAGVLTIDGDLTLSSGSTLAMEIGGLGQGSAYDFLDVNGTLTLAGMLDLSLINAFDSLVQPNDVFTLATADSPILGAFSNVASGDRIWTTPDISFNVWYGLGSIFDPNSLVITGAPEPSRTVLLMTSLLGALMRRRRGTTRLEFRSV
ncbi:MAG: PEP-CTERM sorting domain-containing protein, partial [Prosthecobacter sp.]|uniref:beta strand repeat-containing protein n=1 Tax=Prosthecobacter sp. TaxID=1965333 RepID=UPI0019E18268